MGERLNWLAVERADKADVLARLALAPCGAASADSGASIVCAEFPDDWLVLVSRNRELDLGDAWLQAKGGGFALCCDLDDRVMVSRLRAFRDGLSVWSLAHDPDVDVNGVSIDGQPPPAVEEIRAALAAEWSDDESVDYMFDLPIRLGQRLCGYAHDDPRPVVWTILERAGGRREAPPGLRLPEAFRAEVLPRLEASGWRPAVRHPGFGGGAWDATRVVDGRRQRLAFDWLEHRSDLQFEMHFLVQDGERLTDPVLLAGEVRPARVGGQGDGASFWRRIAGRFRARDVEPASPPDRLADLIARVRGELAAVETFLATGEHDARIRLSRGSVAVLKSS